jgi:hypothetical protein
MANKPFYEEGRYLCEITQQAMGKSAQKGTPQFVLRFKVLECLTPQLPVTQYERTCNLYITEKTIEHFISKLESIGFTGDSLNQLDPRSAKYHNFVGCEAEMYCKHEQGQDGNMYEKWDIARADFESKPIDVPLLDPKELRQLDMLFGKQLKGNRAQPAPTRSAAGSSANAAPPNSSGFEVSDDDVPF